MRLPVLLPILLFAAPSGAAELHQGRCHMDSCTWFSVESVDVVGTGPSGALLKAETRWWSSAHPNGSYEKKTRRTGGERTTGYVLCSKTRPTMVDLSEGKWMTTPLGIGRENSVFGATETATELYFALCHQVSVADPYKETITLGRRFGYRSAAAGDQAVVAKPEDVLRDP